MWKPFGWVSREAVRSGGVSWVRSEVDRQRLGLRLEVCPFRVCVSKLSPWDGDQKVRILSNRDQNWRFALRIEIQHIETDRLVTVGVGWVPRSVWTPLGAGLRTFGPDPCQEP